MQGEDGSVVPSDATEGAFMDKAKEIKEGPALGLRKALVARILLNVSRIKLERR
jgi:hypothetical protein